MVITSCSRLRMQPDCNNCNNWPLKSLEVRHFLVRIAQRPDSLENNVHFIIRRKTNENYISPEEPAMTVCVEGDEIHLEEFVRSKRTVKVHGRADCHWERSSKGLNSVMECIEEAVLVRSKWTVIMRGFSIGMLKTSWSVFKRRLGLKENQDTYKEPSMRWESKNGT